MFNLLKMRRSVVKPLAGPECGQVSKVYTCQFENAASRHRNLQIYRLCEHTGQCHFCLCQDVEHFEPKYPISEANRVHNLAIYMPSVVNLPNAVLNTSFWIALPEEAIVKVFTAVAFSLAPLLYTSLSSVDKLYHTLQFKQRVLRLAGLLGYIGMLSPKVRNLLQ
ncbi:hypothetical protein ACI3LZ_004595 [Candidozyma auris]